MRKYVQEKSQRETKQTKSIEGKRHKIISDKREIKRQRNRPEKKMQTKRQEVWKLMWE